MFIFLQYIKVPAPICTFVRLDQINTAQKLQILSRVILVTLVTVILADFVSQPLLGIQPFKGNTYQRNT